MNSKGLGKRCWMRVTSFWKMERGWKPFDRIEAECAAGVSRVFYVAELREAPGMRGPQRLTERWCLDKTSVGPISSPSSSSSQLDTTPRPTHTHTCCYFHKLLLKKNLNSFRQICCTKIINNLKLLLYLIPMYLKIPKINCNTGGLGKINKQLMALFEHTV